MLVMIPYLAFTVLLALAAFGTGTYLALLVLALACLCAALSNNTELAMHIRTPAYIGGHILGVIAFGLVLQPLL